MKIIKRTLLILIVLSMLLSTGVFAATVSLSYDAGYEAGYDYGYARQGSKVTGMDAYNDSYKDSRAHRTLRNSIEDYKEREFRDGFVDGYTDGHDDKVNASQKLDYPEELGKALGEISGARDFQKGKKSDWRAALPKSTNISSMFDLDKQSSSYRSSFISTFTAAFNEGYNDAYDMASYEPDRITMEQSVIDGEDVGMMVGAAYGLKDFYAGKYLDFKRDLPLNNDIISQYALNNDDPNYEEGFIAGFLSAYEESYNQAFREANMSENINKAASYVIPISGGTASSSDNRFIVDVPAGTFYHDVGMNIIATFDVKQISYGKLIKASDTYTVELSNLSGNINENKLIELSFEYYGDKAKGGIYKYEDNKWLYIPTDAKDGMLTAKINPKTLKSNGTVFSVFVDDNVNAFTDARGHWANDEIDAYIKRGIISGYSDNTFRPDNNITRAEFLTLLSRVFNWNIYNTPGSTATFNDAATFGYYTDVINYATYHSYIYGYTDGSFKPGNLISYTEVETIMNRVLYYQNFRWSNISDSMLYDKKVRSNSFNGLYNNITRAEVVYMLYKTTE